MEAVVEPGAMILDEIARLEVERARTEAKIVRRMLDFADLRRRESALAIDPVIGRLEASFAADELSLVLLQPTMTVQCRLAEARRVRGMLPQVWDAWQRGEIDQYRVRLVAEAADKLQNALSLIELDMNAVAFASSHTPSRLKAWLRRFVARVEPDGQKKRTRTELEKRGVYVDHDSDGVSWVHALIPSTDASRIDKLLTSLARGLGASDKRTLGQRRADLFADLLLGRLDQQGASTGRSHGGAVIGVTIPITSLAGFDDTPGESFDRRLTLPAEMVRALAAEPGTIFYRLLTDPLGRLLDVTEIGRFPSRKLRIALNVRDGMCAFPTCSVPAENCDADHNEPVPRGPTVASNLKHLCRRHHRMKTFGIVETDIGSDGHRWHLPDGSVVGSETYPLATARQPRRESAREIDFASFVIEERLAG